MNDCTTIEFEEIIEMFSPKINKCIQNTPFQERENIEQEIKIKILEKIPVLQDITAPTFFDFIEQSNTSPNLQSE
ncbi:MULTISPECIES: hypothetical protein [Bacillus]|jgi:hypothetical protein|nr:MULTISPECIES: hypothetical protein [Bacillus cereus group]AUD24542.1 hypothetical protein CU648_19720 [Bacillus sp. HBCD-sjtu]KAA2394638.1 hypothetical protein F2Y18_17580 [Bacillus cereus]KXI54494.1 hypothetical protein ACS95_05330 [Bacillus cereus]MCC2349428.1 hypothetical protein [Bacillus pacificus]MCC2469313.1 hypothetical protein [Bacillus pacificus]